MGKPRRPALPPPGPVTSFAVRAVLRRPELRPYLHLVHLVLPDVVAVLDGLEADLTDTVDEVLEQLREDAAFVADVVHKRAQRTPRARGVGSHTKPPAARRRAAVDGVLEDDQVEPARVRKYKGTIRLVPEPERPTTSPAGLLPPASVDGRKN